MFRKLFKKKEEKKQEKVEKLDWTNFITNDEWAAAEENPGFYVELEKIGKKRSEEQKERLR